tara:strand:+ start:1161 stop:1445 length:285 start_codon:yes stop_codon:yes gene_type:complete
LSVFDKLQAIHKCPLSPADDQLCIFAQPVKDTVHCKAVFGWWDDLDIALHDKCFNTILGRDKLLWRNRQLHGWTKGKGTKKKDHAYARLQRKKF